MSPQAIERVAEEVVNFYELPSTPAGVAATFVSVYRLFLRLTKCSPEIAFAVTAHCFPNEYRGFLSSVAFGEMKAVDLPYAGRWQLARPDPDDFNPVDWN
jgi:hypothetical protein